MYVEKESESDLNLSELVDEVIAPAFEGLTVLEMTVRPMVLEELWMLNLCVHTRRAALPDHVETHQLTAGVGENTARETKFLLSD